MPWPLSGSNFSCDNSYLEIPANKPMITNTNDASDSNLSFDNNVSNNTPQHVSIYPNDTPLSHSLINSANTRTQFSADQHLKRFEPNSSDPIIIVIELNESNTSTGFWHPLKCDKFLSNNLIGINNVKQNGHRKG